MAKDERGIWTATIGPLPADMYNYTFSVDGLSIADPRNKTVKLGARSGPTSVLEVSGDRSAFLAIRNVPHGTVHIHHYFSKPVNGMRRLHVYTPPGYDPSARTRYPVLYLLHGSGDTDAEWDYLGRSGIILDNLLADGKAKPMVVVMPDGHAAAGGDNTGKFGEDLLNEVIPLVEHGYRVSAAREQRALAGLSMGGAQTMAVGLPNLDKFSHLGVFSMGVGGRAGGGGEAFEKTHQSVLSKAEETNKKLKLFWIACGKEDFLMPGVVTLRQVLDKNNVKYIYRESEGGHNWYNWRIYLSEFYPMLFK
jgi:enterochelin esterase family protein